MSGAPVNTGPALPPPWHPGSEIPGDSSNQILIAVKWDPEKKAYVGGENEWYGGRWCHYMIPIPYKYPPDYWCYRDAFVEARKVQIEVEQAFAAGGV